MKNPPPFADLVAGLGKLFPTVWLVGQYQADLYSAHLYRIVPRHSL